MLHDVADVTFENDPAAHRSQLAADADAYDPIGHARHACRDVAPMTLEDVPAAQFWQLTAPASDHVPVPHTMHDVCPTVAYVPALQVRQDEREP